MPDPVNAPTWTLLRPDGTVAMTMTSPGEVTLVSAEAHAVDTAARTLLSELDRCVHGRHEGDDCSGCKGPSVGNRLLRHGKHIGYDISGRHIYVPNKGDRVDYGNAENWGRL